MIIIFHDTPIYLGLGGALAAMGLILAVYQLRTPKWDIVLSIRRPWQKRLFWVLGGAGLLLTLFRVLLPEQPIEQIPALFRRAIFYEISAYLFFIASPVSLMFFANKNKGLFNKKTASDFYEVMAQRVSRTNDEDVNALLPVLLSNLENICLAIKDTKNVETGHLARAIINVILSDEVVVKVITTKQLYALLFIFEMVEKHNIRQKDFGVGMPKIMNNLFNDKESFLYKHLKRTGLALSSNAYETIFSSSTILNNFDLYGYPALSYTDREETNIESIEVLIESLSRSMKMYLKTGDASARRINEGLSYLSDIFGDMCSKISIAEKPGVETTRSLKNEWRGVYAIARFLGHGYVFLAYQDELHAATLEREKRATEASFHSNESINDGIAAILFKAFVQLSYIKKDRDVHDTVIRLLTGMIYHGEHKTGYRDPFLKAVWEQIASNVKKQYYPAILKSYLMYVGLDLALGSRKKPEWVNEQAERMRRLLYVDLKPLLEKNIEMADGAKMEDVLLPSNMEYKKGYFFYTTGFGKGEEKRIDRPKEGAKSALSEIDLNDLSYIAI